MPETYNIGSGLTDQEMQLASFWVRNRPLMQRIGYGAIIAVGAALWIFVIWTLLDAYAISYPREQRIPRRIIENALVTESLFATAPQPVQLSDVAIFDTTDARQDMLVELTNPNAQWYATFDYAFELAGERTPTRKGNVLPFSKKYLTELGYPSKTKSRTAKLVVENVEWMRVIPANVDGDYATFAERRLQMTAESIQYRNDLKIGTRTIGQSSFLLRNGSAYGYWNVDLTVVLFRGNSAVGVTTIRVKEVKPGEVRPITVEWFDNLTGISKTEVRIDTDILDSMNYLPASRF